MIVSKWGGYLHYATDQLGNQAHVHSVQIGWGTHF
jgi:hypothetical protein